MRARSTGSTLRRPDVYLPRCVLLSLALASSTLVSTGCSMKQIVASNMTGLLEEVEREYLAERSYLAGREAGAALLKILDGVIASDPGNEELLALGVRLDTQFAFGFVDQLGEMSEEEEEYARSLYARAKAYGLAALDDEKLNSALSKNVEEVRSALARYDDPEDVPLLFWTGLAIGGWINRSKDSIGAVADLPVAVAFMERVIELDEGYFHGGAHLFLAQYHGSRGKDLGGDPEKARLAAERAWEISDGKLLLAKVFLARFHAVPAQDAREFERVLEEVLEAPGDLLPGEELATAIAKHKARNLLLEMEDFFVE